MNIHKTQMFCLPPAGCSASIYKSWAKSIHSNLDTIPIEYPGHGLKMAMPLMEDVNELALHVADDMVEATNHPYVLFGHSLGGGLVWKVYEHLQKKNAVRHLKLIVISCRPELSFSQDIQNKHLLSQAELISVLKRYNYCSEELFNNTSAFAYFSKIIRNDFKLSDQLIQSKIEKINTPLMVVYGQDDPDIGHQNMMEAWKKYSSQWRGVTKISGDHFYFMKEQSLKELFESIQLNLNV